jgi:SAM-dependent methyltransferase
MLWRAEVTARLRELLGQSPDTVPTARVASKRDGLKADARRAPGLESRVLLLDDPASGAGLNACRLQERGAPVAEASLDALVVWFAATSPAPARRVEVLAEAGRVLRCDGVLIVVDHNRPRTWWRRLRNAIWCLRQGVDPLRRPTYPVAREVLAAGFEDVALRLACAEKIQLVRGRRATWPGP